MLPASKKDQNSLLSNFTKWQKNLQNLQNTYPKVPRNEAINGEIDRTIENE